MLLRQQKTDQEGVVRNASATMYMWQAYVWQPLTII